MRDISAGLRIETSGQMLASGRLWRSAAGPHSMDLARSVPNMCVIDLRHKSELSEALPWPRTVRLERLPIWPALSDNRHVLVRDTDQTILDTISNHEIDETMTVIYQSLAVEFDSQWRNLFQLLLEESIERYLILCRRGVDRSGVASSLILRVLGVSLDKVYSEYSSISNKTIPPRHSYLAAFFDAIESKHGSFDKFAKTKLDLNEDTIKQLTNKFTSPPRREK